MKPYLHGLVSVKKFGGKPEDYQAIHDWFDQVKAHVPDMRHRAILHNSFGIYLCEMFFGATFTNSDGKVVSTRDVGEQHVLDDLGTIPTVQDYLTHLPWLDWLGGPKREKGVKADEAVAGKALEKAAATQQPLVPYVPSKQDILDGAVRGLGAGIGIGLGEEIRRLEEQRKQLDRLQKQINERTNFPLSNPYTILD